MKLIISLTQQNNLGNNQVVSRDCLVYYCEWRVCPSFKEKSIYSPYVSLMALQFVPKFSTSSY